MLWRALIILLAACMPLPLLIYGQGVATPGSATNRPKSDSAKQVSASRKDTTSSGNHTAKKKKTLNGIDDPKEFINILICDLYTTANVLHYDNALTADQKNELNFYYNFTINNSLKTKYFTLRTYIFNEYGVRHYLDSITTKGQDKYTIKNTLQVQLTPGLKILFAASVQSQLWPTYQYPPGGRDRILYTSYFSPGYMNFSSGASFKLLKGGTLDLGIIGGKITKIRKQQIYDERGVSKLYGIGKDERKAVDYGLSLHFNVPPQHFNKHFVWECYLDGYAPKNQIGRLKGYTLDAMNVFHYICFKNVRLSFRTFATYDENVSSKLFLSNMLSIGFYLTNEI